MFSSRYKNISLNKKYCLFSFLILTQTDVNRLEVLKWTRKWPVKTRKQPGWTRKYPIQGWEMGLGCFGLGWGKIVTPLLTLSPRLTLAYARNLQVRFFIVVKISKTWLFFEDSTFLHLSFCIWCKFINQ